jgi:chaperonin GroEL
VGAEIVRRAMEAPIRQILMNAGVASPDLIIEQVRSEKSATRGYNAQTMEHTDLVKAGVVDPTKVVRHALQNAASVSGLLLTTEALVSDMPEDEEEHGHGHGGGMGDF